MHGNVHGIKECHWERTEQTWSGGTATESLVCLVPHVCFSRAYFVHAQIFSLCACTCVSECLCRHVWACGARDLQQTSSVALLLSFSLFCFVFLFVQGPTLNLTLAVWTRLVGQWAPGIPLSLIFSTGITDTHHLPDFYLVLGFELKS